MRPYPLERKEASHFTRHTALLPAFALLGIALPLLFLARIEQYLHYLRPIELLPTYATAWLLLALPSIPLCLVAALALSALHRRGQRRLERVLGFALLWLAAATALGAVLLDAVIWLRTFESARQGGIDSGIG